jgi:hypothetical protein
MNRDPDTAVSYVGVRRSPVRTSNPIPQSNGGDHDGDNNGGPGDGDGNI